jgi:hypothetical protein
LGAKTRPKAPPPERLRLRDAVARAYTPEQLEKILKRLSPDQAARLLSSLEPRMREDAPASTFTLKIVGLGDGNTCPSCGWMQDPEAYRKIIIEKHRAANVISEDKDGRRGRSWREDARAQGESVPSVGPKSPRERIDGGGDDAQDPPRQRLLDPAGNPISFAPPDTPRIPYGSGGVP